MSSPDRPPIDLTTIEVDQGFLPTPATKLVITQYLASSPDEPFWAWIIVGAFFDRNDRIVWSTELFAGHLEIDPELSDSSSESESSNSEAETAYSSVEARDSSPDLAYHSENDDPRDQSPHISHWLRQQQQEAPPPPSPPPTRLIQPQQVAYSNWHSPPTSWDPTQQGQVPGYWQASFNPSLRRWVHTWQPLC